MRAVIYLVFASIIIVVGLHLTTEINMLKHQNEILQKDIAFLETQVDLLESELEENIALLENIRQTHKTAVLREGTVSAPSGFNAAMLETAWENLGATGLQGTGATFIEAEKQHGVNALFLAAIAYLESGGGTSQIAQDKNNLFGLGAHDVDPYNYAVSFDCKNESVVYAAELLERNYLSRGGKHYSGDNAYGVGVNYATDPLWPIKVYGTMEVIADQAFDVSLIDS